MKEEPTLEQRLKVLTKICVRRRGKFKKVTEGGTPYCTLFYPTNCNEPYHCPYAHQLPVTVKVDPWTKMDYWYCGLSSNIERDDEWKD
jgi:G:T-mismatch repair DNA endonuclease (very short patch repair protein)|tara:strand:+ start:856 stop:1119 length:264 start_codon:yes stop_codon:yes gene_type:complete